MKFLVSFWIAMIAGGVLSATPKKPNFVFLIADDLGMGDVGCFGNDTISTPNIDSIATDGAKLTHHLATAAVCTPSRASFLTGRYAVRQGMEAAHGNKVLLFIASSGGLPANETTFPKILQEQGYATALIGKWHLGWHCNRKGDRCHHPLNHGFDYFYGLPLTNLKDFGDDGDAVAITYYPQLYTILNSIMAIGVGISVLLGTSGNHKLAFLFAFIFTLLPMIISTVMQNMKLLNSVVYRNDEVVEQPIRLNGLTQRLVQEAREFVTEQANAGKPFVLFLPFVHVHTALFTAPEFANRSRHGRYGDNVEEMDWAVGEVLRILEETGVSNDTFVYFSSDNGGHIEERGLRGDTQGGYNGHFKGGKCMGGMEGGIRVPTVVKWPGTIPPGLEISVPTSQMDIFPTVLQALHLEQPRDHIIDGKSIISLLNGSESASPHTFLFHYCGTELHAARYVQGTNIWKVHFAAPKWLPGTYRCEYVCQCFGHHAQTFTPPRLFNLKDDPFEDDILNPESDPVLRRVVREISDAIESHRKTIFQVPLQFGIGNSLWKPWLQPCCNFPFCSCTDPKYPK